MHQPVDVPRRHSGSTCYCASIMNYVNLLTFFSVIVWNIRIIRSSVQCVDESGKPVDWYVLYKLPEIEDEPSFVGNGSAYLYITSETLQDGWIQSDQPIYSEHSIVARTLKNLYETQNDEIWVVYNDQGPLKSGLSYGHTKGVIGANRSNGFWLIHSVPHFPSPNHEYSYPKSGHKNGQSMLCISFLKNQIDTLGQILMYYKPLILEKRISSKLRSEYPQLVAAAEGARVRKAPWQLFSSLNSARGRKFTNFAKAKKFNKDLYEWVADKFQTSILAETWLNDVHPLPSSCSTYQVLNVESIQFADQSIEFSSHKDHSKWAISKSSSKPWVCIGDINRAAHQEKRGGGTMCLEDKKLWNAYNSIVQTTSDCKSHKFKDKSTINNI